MSTPEVPVWALTHLTHAALQRAANRVGVDLLHIKGPATLTSLRAGRHDSTDADVWVRPSQLDRFIAGLEEDGWSLYTDFDEGSPFGHAANYTHAAWTYADVHKLIPGPLAGPEAVFDRLWADREVAQIGHQPCNVLSVAGQVLVQTLHAARSHGYERPEAWTLCPDEVRPAVRQLAAELRAETAFAAGIRELSDHSDAEDHALWRYWSTSGDDRLAEWVARYRSARGLREKARVVRQSLRVNRTHLRIRLRREPTRADIAREQRERITHAFRSGFHLLFRREKSS